LSTKKPKTNKTKSTTQLASQAQPNVPTPAPNPQDSTFTQLDRTRHMPVQETGRHGGARDARGYNTRTEGTPPLLADEERKANVMRSGATPKRSRPADVTGDPRKADVLASRKRSAQGIPKVID
jgi:hypothetical protein